MNRIIWILMALVSVPFLLRAQNDSIPGNIVEIGDTVAQPQVADSVSTPPENRNRVTVTPVDIDDNKREPVLHYYDKHGDPLDEPVLFLATLDTVPKPKAKPNFPLFNGVTVGINFGDALMAAFGQKYGSYDIQADVSLFNWIFPVFEAGLGFVNTTPENKNYTYRVRPSFYAKLGFNYNFLYKSDPAYQLFLGFRAAFSRFSWAVDNVTIESPYWQESTTFNMRGMKSTAFWGEALAGIKVKIVSGFSLGWSFRWHFPFHIGKGKPGSLPDGIDTAALSTPWFIPGYGGSSSFCFTLTASWTFAQKQSKAAPEVPEEPEDLVKD